MITTGADVRARWRVVAGRSAVVGLADHAGGTDGQVIDDHQGVGRTSDRGVDGVEGPPTELRRDGEDALDPEGGFRFVGRWWPTRG